MAVRIARDFGYSPKLSREGEALKYFTECYSVEQIMGAYVECDCICVSYKMSLF